MMYIRQVSPSLCSPGPFIFVFCVIFLYSISSDILNSSENDGHFLDGGHVIKGVLITNCNKVA